MLRLVLATFVSLFLAGSVSPAEARPAQKKSVKATKKKTVAKKGTPVKRKKKSSKKKKRAEPSEPRRPMP